MNTYIFDYQSTDFNFQSETQNNNVQKKIRKNAAKYLVFNESW